MKKLYALAVAILCAATATAANGDVTNGWLMLEDFEGAAPEMSIINVDNGKDGQGTLEIATIAKDGNENNKVVKFTPGGYGHGIKLVATLPEGKTIADYTDFKIDFYCTNGKNDYKPFRLYIDGNKLFEENAVISGENVWKEFTKGIQVTGNNNKVTFWLYCHASSSITLVYDNICLKEKNGGSTEDPDPQPEGFNETTNGTVSEDGVLMVNDLQQHGAVDVALSIWARKDNSGNQNAPKGTAKTAVDPTDAKNLTAHFTGGDYNTVLEFDVKLPEGKTLADYSAILFDLYRNSGDADNKNFRVQADDEVIHVDTSYPSQGNKNKWQNRSYNIPEDTQVGNSFKLRLGIESNEADYLIDNIRLVERPAAEIELVGEPQINITHAKVAGAMTIDYTFNVANYSGEEVKVTATLNGHDEVIFEEYIPEATDAPARAAGENKTFGGTLKAQHDALKNLSNAQVTLTATAGEKQLFAITEAPHTTTGIEDAAVDSAAAAEYYNLNGMRVDATQLAPGIYIRKTGDKAEKVLVK